MKINKSAYLFLTAGLIALLYSCASIGNPEGGPIDKTPPIFIGSNPRPMETKVDRSKIELTFDEIVTLKDPQTKIIVSPAQIEMPKISANGRKVTVELVDTMKENTTYTIDFSNAIQDNNEGNPLENFAFAFSTGESIDSLSISGIVLDSHTLEPQQGVLVGVHSNLADSALTTLPFDRISRTNDRGQFTVRNMKPGKYHVFALNDMDRDFKFNRSENVAFCDSIIIPSTKVENFSDTTFAVGHKVDTVMQTNRTVFLPNDILLNMFNENYKAQYLTKYERIDSTRIFLKMAAEADTLPSLKILNMKEEVKDWYVLERSEKNDSLVYWIKDLNILSNDTLQLEVKTQFTDTLENLVWKTDTLDFKFRRPKAPKKKKRHKDEEEDSLPQIKFLPISLITPTTHEVYAAVEFEVNTPIDSLNPDAIHLDIKQDTLWNEVKDFRLAYKDSLRNKRRLTLRHSWEPGANYRLRVDSLGITSIYGEFNKPLEAPFIVRNIEDYGNLFFNITGVTDMAFVELLNASDNVIMTVPVKAGRAEFINLLPAKYYARLVFDRNGNGKYDTGNYALKQQPEEVVYFAKGIKLKRNWDMEQNWDIYELPIDMQKPIEIKKNKPERKKWGEEEKRNQQGFDDEEDNGFNDFGDENDPNMRRFNRMNGYDSNYNNGNYNQNYFR